MTPKNNQNSFPYQNRRRSSSRRTAGATFAETLVAAGIMAFLTTILIAVTGGSARTYDNARAVVFSDLDAVIAMQRIMEDVREAKSVDILSSGQRLQITFPKRTAQGYYLRTDADNANKIDYFLSDSTGAMGRTGTYLWKGKGGVATQLIRNDVSEINFEQDTSRSVRITVVTRNAAASGPMETRLTERVVYLRNY